MNREAKIKLLQAIADGSLPPDINLEPTTHVLIQSLNEKGSYLLNGVEYSEEEYKAIRARIDAKNKILQANGLPIDEIIEVIYVPGKTIL